LRRAQALLDLQERAFSMDIITHHIDSLLVKQAFSRLAAETSIVTLIDQNQVRMGLTVTAVTAVSLEPPLVLVCVNNHSRTIPVFKAGGPFAINMLRLDQKWIGMQFASQVEDKFAQVDTVPGKHGGLLIKDTLASFECEPFAIHEAGDHHIIVGRILDIHIGPDARPLVYYRSQFLD
jgi:flavin reductase (DIM6/NTAB) family NADH-FMN oxidoreductase RutF